MLQWRIYYSDGSTFSSDDGAPSDAPPWGVVSVVGRDPDDNRRVYPMQGTGFDFFVWDGREWWGCDFVGLVDRLAHNSALVVRFGRTIPTEDFRRITTQAVEDLLNG